MSKGLAGSWKVSVSDAERFSCSTCAGDKQPNERLGHVSAIPLHLSMASLYIKSSLQRFLPRCSPVPIATVSFSSLWPHLQPSPHSTAYLRSHHYRPCRHPAFPAYFMSRFIYLLFCDCFAPGSSLASPMQSVPNRSPMRCQQVALLAKPGTFLHLNLNHHWTERLCYLHRKTYCIPNAIPKVGGEQILAEKTQGLE